DHRALPCPYTTLFRSLVLQQARLRGRRLDYGAVRREVAAQDREPARGNQRPLARQDHVGIEHLRAFEVLPERPAAHRLRVEIERSEEHTSELQSLRHL